MIGQWKLLEWDSAFFGFPTARILPARLDEAALLKVLAALCGAKTELAYWAVDPDDAESNRAAVACGGFLADVKITYAVEPVVSHAGRIRHAIGTVAPGGVIKPINPVAAVALATSTAPREPESDGDGSPALYALAVEAGKYSRFNLDPGFPPALFRALYVEWMRKSLSGEKADAVLVADEAGHPMGMITVQAKDGVGSIGLVAVDAGRQGRGLGTSLIQFALGWFAARSCGRVEVVTQERNREACRLYERNGFRKVGNVNVYHFRPMAK